MRNMILTSSVLITAILIIRGLAKGKIPARMQYALWLLVFFRLVIPGSLSSSPISVLNLLRMTTAYTDPNTDLSTDTVGSIIASADAGIDAYIGGIAEENADRNEDIYANRAIDSKGNANLSGNINAESYTDKSSINENGTDKSSTAGIPTKSRETAGDVIRAVKSNINTVLFCTWILGILITGGYMLIYQIRFIRYLSSHRKPLHGKNREYCGLEVYTVKGLPSPCLCGKRIYLTKEMAEDEKMVTHILAHEYCHYRQFDPLWAIARCVLVSVYWFHPLVWAAAYASKQDSEFACDEAAIRLLGEKERYDYGRTLLSLVRSKASGGSALGPLLTMSGSEKGMRERISRIAGKPGNLVLAGGLVLILVAVFAVITFTGIRSETDGDALSEMTIGNGAEAGTAESATESESVAQENEENPQEMVDPITGKMEPMDVEAEARQKAEELAAKEAQELEESQNVIAFLSDYDQLLFYNDSSDITELPGTTIVQKPYDAWEDYLEQGEDALTEGIYLLAGWNGREGQSMPKGVNDLVADIISVYGLYTKEYGLRGVKVVVGKGTDKDVNNYDIPWSLLGNSMIHVFETAPEDEAPDGLPRTFAFKQLVPGTEKAYMNYGPEVYELYLCDRYDIGHIELSRISGADCAAQVSHRISCKVNREDQKVYVYDTNILVGAIDMSDVSMTDIPAMDSYPVEKAVVDTNYFDFSLGTKVENVRLHTMINIGIQPEDSDTVLWRHGLPSLAFPVDCGYFGPDREFMLGQATIDPRYISMTLSYSNPCPDYTRISDAFGARIHPITGEVRKHEGVDLSAGNGAPVLAAADGTVYETGYDAEYGNYVVLYHAADNSYTCYTHCSEILVSKDSQVAKEQQIAAVGSTGRSTGAHLHFAAYRDGAFVEPVFEE